MAVTGSGTRILKLAANADAVTGKLIIKALAASGACAAVVDTGDHPVWEATAEAHISFDPPIILDGIKRGDGAGSLYVYLA